MFLLAFYAFLRIGEITSRSKTYHNLLMFQDVTLHKYKSSQTTVNLKMLHFKHSTSKHWKLRVKLKPTIAQYENKDNFYDYVEDPKVQFFATGI
jgi:hypothetical protein